MVIIFGFIALILIGVMITAAKNQNPAVTVSTTNREPLSAAACVESDEWYDDQAGWITNQSQMIQGLKTFYRETGVQPYVMITNEVNGKGEDLTDSEAEAYLQERYDSLFADEGHLIFLFMEYEDSVYKEYLYLGNQASSVVDREAQEIIYDYADYYYTSDLDDNMFFSTVFEKSAERIMQKTTTGNDVLLNLTKGFAVMGVIGMIGLVVVLRKRHAARVAEERRRILETPIEKLSDTDLKNKYKD